MKSSSRKPTRVVFLALVVLLAFLPSQAQATSRLAVVLSGRFDAGDHTKVVAATVSPVGVLGATQAPPPELPVILTAACRDTAPCDAAQGTSASWDFGDGSTTTTTGLSVAHPYRDPGVYIAKVNLRTAGGVGTAQISVLVSPRYADVDADLVGKTGRVDREAVWAASSLGLLAPCRTAFPALDPNDALGTAQNRGVFCPEPSLSFAPSTPPSMPAAAVGNGLTGVSCLQSWDSCGLPVKAFADNAGQNPLAACNAACQNALKTDPYNALESDNRLKYNPLNCLDGWSAARQSGAWVIVPGVEPGCVSRGEFFRALILSVDGKDAPSNRLVAPTSFCADGPGAGVGSFEMRRAQSLGVPVTHKRLPNGNASAGENRCDPAMPVTKAEAYSAISYVTGLPRTNLPSLRDLEDRTLGHGAKTPYPNAALIGAVLAKGGPLVGTTSCADEAGACFTPEEGLTRSQLSVLFAGLFVGMPTTAAGIEVGIVPSKNPNPVGTPVRLTVTARTPASVPLNTPLQVSWSKPVSGVSSLTNCSQPEVANSPVPTQSINTNASQIVSLTCDYNRSLSGTAMITATVRDSSGNFSSASVPLVYSNSAPRISDTNMGTSLEDASKDVTINANDPEGFSLGFKVKSFLPGEKDPGVYPTNRRATTSWSVETETSVGKVKVLSSSAQSVTLRLSPDPDANGPYSFALQVCDNSTCTVRTVSGDVTPVNDPPLASNITVSGPETLNIKLIGSDAKDKTEISLYRIDSLPSGGTLEYDADPSAGTNYVGAAPGATTNNPLLRWTIADENAGTFTFTYSVQDSGTPTPALWSLSPGTVGLYHTVDP